MSEIHPGFLHNIFLQHAHEVNAFIRGRWPGEQDVADIVQESFLRLSQYPKPETIHNPRAFLFQTAANVVVDRHRRRETRERYLEPDADIDNVADEQSSTERTCEAREALAHFTEWLAELPELQQHAFILFRIEGCSHVECAKRLGISVRCSERYVNLAMQHISMRLDSFQR